VLLSRAQLVDGGVICEATEVGAGFVAVGDLIRAGEPLGRAGQRVESDLLGILARAGIRSVEVHPRPRVLVVTVGSEYVEPGVPTPTGLVADHLSQLAAALVTEHGAITFRIPPVLDDLAEITQVVDDNAHRSDLIVLCGLEPETAPAIADALGLSLVTGTSRSSGEVVTSEPVIHGMSGGAVIVGLPDDSTQLRASAREILPRILDRLMGRSAHE
jgi:molybdopterin biosynthesis enzyme